MNESSNGRIIIVGDITRAPAELNCPPWFDRGQDDRGVEMPPIRPGNKVTILIDGVETFRAMVDAIRTANNNDHYIYMLNWFMDLDFELVPGTRLGDLLSSAVRSNVQVRAMLWDQFGRQNSAEVRRINSLSNGGAILDNNTLNFGSHHQKILIVKGTEELVAFCGGIDFNPDRLRPSGGGARTGPTTDPGEIASRSSGSSGGAGGPLHDVHCKIEGPSAWDLLQIFVQRWTDHPDSTSIDGAKGTLRGLTEAVPSSLGNMCVQIGRTFGNGSLHGGIRNIRGDPFYSFAPHGEQTAKQVIFHAIRQAKRFIYMEDQYLISMEASRILQAQIPNIKFLIILIPDSGISDLPRVWELRRRFIAPLMAVPGASSKVAICFRSPAGSPHTYVHAKMFVVDDEFAIIGSANCNNRGYTHDSEVVAGICGMFDDNVTFAQELRIRLWREHLGLSRADVFDPIASARHWFSPPSTSSISIYNPTGGTDPIWQRLIPESIIDPDGS